MARPSLHLILVVILVRSSMQTLEDDIAKRMNSSSFENALSRKRRYLTFPAGSSLQLVYCLTIPSVGIGAIFTFGATAALAWELPSRPQELYDKFGKRPTTTTTEAPTTTLPPLIHEHEEFDPSYSVHPAERIDEPSKNFTGGWNKYPGPFKSNSQTYYNPFLIDKPSVFGYTPANSMSNRPVRTWQNSISNSEWNARPSYVKDNRFRQNKYNSSSPASHPVTTYLHPVYHEIHRRTRRDLYEKLEKLFSALSKDGKACLLKAICEVSQVAESKGTFMEEIFKAIFRIKPHEHYPDEDDYDKAANKSHECTEQYPTCENSIWTNMF